MQLLAIVLYNQSGQQRVVDFESGALNVVTGAPGTGKSALLDIVEYCLGRSAVTMSVGPITQTVAWYAVLLQLSGGRAFIARPAPRRGAASSSQAMLEIGAHIEPLPFERLEVNSDAETVREQLGRAIGIGENATEPGRALRPSLEANLGHALLLCLQRQGEVGNRDLLFHRQGEESGAIGRAIQDTLPYFLGAVPRDQAVQRQLLLNARRDLRRAQEDLSRARAADENVEVSVRAMVQEAVVAGLLPNEAIEGRSAMNAALESALTAPEISGDEVVAERRQHLERERSELRLALRAAGEQLALIESMENDEGRYGGIVSQQISRLRSLELLGDGAVAREDACPVCGKELDDIDADVEELRQAAEELRDQLKSVEAVRPRRGEAIKDLSKQVDDLRQQLRAADEALAGLNATEPGAPAQGSRAEQQAFTKGRIQHFVATARAAEPDALARLQQRVQMHEEAVTELEIGLDPDDEREQITSRS